MKPLSSTGSLCGCFTGQAVIGYQSEEYLSRSEYRVQKAEDRRQKTEDRCQQEKIRRVSHTRAEAALETQSKSRGRSIIFISTEPVSMNNMLPAVRGQSGSQTSEVRGRIVKTLDPGFRLGDGKKSRIGVRGWNSERRHKSTL